MEGGNQKNALISGADRPALAQSFGEVRTLYSQSKQRYGVIIVAYYDLRAAVSAKTTLQGTLINGKPLEIHFSKNKPGGSQQDPVAMSQVGSVVDSTHLQY